MAGRMSIDRLLLERERVGAKRSAFAALYGAKEWVERMDITNELFGHQGCVNALCWSQSGDLLASGSDDTHVNLYTTSPVFNLNTSIATGHRANIFSVKFMPYSSDRTIVSAAGDHQVRIFDIEYAPTVKTVEKGNIFTQDPKPLHEVYENESTRVYRSHKSRVKRIVTQDSPYLFLTCAEDGDVRQFDLRQPSSFYARVGRAGGNSSFQGSDSERNPPLIAYSRYGIELNTISCSLAQPYYIALGGGHRYGFLHDRRMLGRDKRAETGKPGRRDDVSDNAATRCVRRFTPMEKGIDNSDHITSCKISNSNPNEVLFSWSGDNVYLFDINLSPEELKGSGEPRAPPPRRTGSNTTATRPTKRRRVSLPTNAPSRVLGSQSMSTVTIPRLFCNLRREIFNPESAPSTEEDFKEAFTTAICTAKVLLDRMKRFAAHLDRINRVNLPFLEERGDRERMRQARRKNREKAMAFVQNAGTLASAFGGDIKSEEGVVLPSQQFDIISTGLDHDGKMVFWRSGDVRVLFLRAILHFVGHGANAMREMVWNVYRPLTPSDTELGPDDFSRAKDEFLDEHLEHIISGSSSLEVIRTSDHIRLFQTHTEAARAFKIAISNAREDPNVWCWEVRKSWGIDVGRSLLMEIFSGCHHQFVENAFRADSGPMQEVDSDEDLDRSDELDRGLQESGDDGDATVREGVAQAGSSAGGAEQGEGPAQYPVRLPEPALVFEPDSDQGDEEDEEADDDNMDEDEEDEEEGVNDDDEEDEDEDEDDEDEDTEMYFGPSSRRRIPWQKVEDHAPIWEHTKMYTGHCNVRTVKDVNFYGLRDEYVVSGCDSGHVFIWDRKSGQLVQLLKGDEETANVIQGHPTRPQMAVSGIDHTIKIFSPDARDQEAYRSYIFSTRGVPSSDLPTYTAKFNPNTNLNTEDPEGISRRRMYAAYQIMSSNEQLREAGLNDSEVTVSAAFMLFLMERRWAYAVHMRDGDV